VGEDALADHLPQVSMIVVMPSPPEN
jgi:hypothetical protein